MVKHKKKFNTAWDWPALAMHFPELSLNQFHHPGADSVVLMYYSQTTINKS
jgi:hypothetical protein